MKIDPGNEEARKRQTIAILFQKALQEENSGNYKKALEYYRMTLQLDTQFFDSWLNAGAIYSKTGKPDKAKYCYQKAIASKADPRAYYNLASVYFKEEKYADARDTLQSLIKKDPRFLPAHLLLGYTYSKLGELDKAEISIKNVLAMDSKNKAALSSLAVLYYERENDAMALRFIERILNDYPQDIMMQKLKSSIFLKKNNEKESIHALKKIAENDPKLRKIYDLLESDSGKEVKESIQARKKIAESKSKKDKKDWFDLSLMHLLDGNPKTALDYLLNAIEKN